MFIAQWAGQAAAKTDFAYHRFLATELVSGNAILDDADATVATAVAYTSPDTARALTVEVAGSVEVGSVKIDGVDGAGAALSATVAVTGGAGPVDIDVAFWKVDTVTPAGFTSGTLDVGIQDKFGLPLPLAGTACVFIQLVGKSVDAGTLTPGSNSANADANGLWEPVTWASSKTFEIVYLATEV